MQQLIDQSGVFFLHQNLTLYYFHHLHCPFLPHWSNHELAKLLLVLTTSLRLVLDLFWHLLTTAFRRAQTQTIIFLLDLLVDLVFLNVDRFLLLQDYSLLGEQFVDNEGSLFGEEFGSSERKLVAALFVGRLARDCDQLDHLLHAFVGHAA